MKIKHIITLLTLLTSFAYASDKMVTVKPFGKVRLIDKIDCSSTDAQYLRKYRFVEYPQGGSKIENILGRPCRTMKMQSEDSSFVSYRIGEGKGLKASGSYVLVIDYPEDISRSWVVHNKGTGSKRGFYIGKSTGNAYQAKYVDIQLEITDTPLSGQYEKWTCFTTLQDRFFNYNESALLLPKDGFDVVVAQYARRHDPLSNGFAIRSISLYEIPDESTTYAKLVLPPKNLPQRHLFWREEMSDNNTIQGDDNKRGMINRLDWFDHKARQMKFLGMNTFTKDLLEFGHVQHWDPGAQKPNWLWDSPERGLWEEIVNLMNNYGFYILPYYEYAGGNGPGAIGPQKRAQTLSGQAYTHIWWITDKMNADVTDPDTLKDFNDVVDGTVTRFKDKAKFAGIWIRPRYQLPIGFADATRQRFAKDVNNGVVPSKQDLQNSMRGDKKLYNKYIRWWEIKRRDWLVNVKKHMNDVGLKNTDIIYTNCGSEPGPTVDFGLDIAVDNEKTLEEVKSCLNQAPWNNKNPALLTIDEIVKNHKYYNGLLKPTGTWGQWEWQHCSPANDPNNYKALSDIYLGYSYHRLFSVSDPLVHEKFSNKSQGTAMIQHYPLNEHMLCKKANGKEEAIVGYAIADMEKAGRACMQNEIMAMAKGNPYYLGYLVGSTYSRGFPLAVRDFDINYLALPALPSKEVPNACFDPTVVLKEIRTPNNGTYYAVIHTGDTNKKVTINFPDSCEYITHVISGSESKGPTLELRLKPWQLIAFHVKKR